MRNSRDGAPTTTAELVLLQSVVHTDPSSCNTPGEKMNESLQALAHCDGSSMPIQGYA